MTEAEWLACSDPNPMLRFVKPDVNDRRLRLFGVACCRRVWHRLIDFRSQHAIEIIESFIEANTSQAEVEEARKQAEMAYEDARQTQRQYSGQTAALVVASALVWNLDHWPCIGSVLIFASQAAAESAQHTGLNKKQRKQFRVGALREEGRIQAYLLRDIFGNPFRPVVLDSTWRSSTAHAISQQMYESRDFSAMPILADALQDAGCDSDDVLNHCRDANGVHVRGCWVVDLVLGKA